MAKTTKATKSRAKKKMRATARAKKPARKTSGKTVSAKKKSSNKPAPRKASNRRKHRRIPTRSLWVTELCGEYRYLVQAANISEGGIFLNGRLKTMAPEPSLLRIQSKEGEVVDLAAKAVHDVIESESYGAGYQFVDMTSAQTRTLRGLLRDLD